MEKEWYVYILECSDKTLYTGITTDLERRINEHNGSSKGAKYTRTRRPVRMVYFEVHDGRSNSSKREREIKKLSRKEKLEMIRHF